MSFLLLELENCLSFFYAMLKAFIKFQRLVMQYDSTYSKKELLKGGVKCFSDIRNTLNALKIRIKLHQEHYSVKAHFYSERAFLHATAHSVLFSENSLQCPFEQMHDSRGLAPIELPQHS